MNLPSFVANGYLIVGAVGVVVISAVFFEKWLASNGHVTAAKTVSGALKLALPAGFAIGFYKLVREVISWS